jgi:hypothetical protein
MLCVGLGEGVVVGIKGVKPGLTERITEHVCIMGIVVSHDGSMAR